MLTNLIGDMSSIQSDLKFYLKLMNVEYPPIDQIKEKYYKEFVSRSSLYKNNPQEVEKGTEKDDNGAINNKVELGKTGSTLNSIEVKEGTKETNIIKEGTVDSSSISEEEKHLPTEKAIKEEYDDQDDNDDWYDGAYDDINDFDFGEDMSEEEESEESNTFKNVHTSDHSIEDDNNEIYSGTEKGTIDDKVVSCDDKTINYYKQDDSWRSESEVGNIENLWDFDEMDDIDPKIADKLLYSVIEEADKVRKESGFTSAGDLTKFHSIRGVSKGTDVNNLKVQDQKSESSISFYDIDNQNSEISEQKLENIISISNANNQKTENKNLEERKDLGTVYKSLRDFIKKHPNCLVSEASEYFSKDEISKEVRLGRVYLSRGRLFI